MKFIATKGAPNIPLELLEAQEAGKLILFCGAGISVPIEMPSFAALVDRVYEDLNTEKNEAEASAIKGGFLDRALSLLEQRMGSILVRESIIKILSIDHAAKLDFSTHEAILQLSKTKQGHHRLVTTNVDRAFSLVNPALLIHAAPTLPIPKDHKWKSVVHLHGIIDSVNDPNGENLIFTSGDFGSAYMEEGWATKFVTELFRHHTVLFLGYSVNDPILRYIIDAIAAERLRGSTDFFQPYTLAKATPRSRDSEKAAWQAKGIEPIFYSHSHSNLHGTIKAWARHTRDGIEAKEKIIREYAAKPPLGPYSDDEDSQKVIDTLKEKTSKNQTSVTGFPAKIFREIKAPIEWLPVLHEQGLLSGFVMPEKVLPACHNPIQNVMAPNKICIQLWSWLCIHLENRDLIQWVIKHGGQLHPIFKRMVASELQNLSNPVYLKFWQIVISDNLYLPRDQKRVESYKVLNELEQDQNNLSLIALENLLAPSYDLHESNIAHEDSPPYQVEVCIGLTTYYCTRLNDLIAENPSRFIALLIPATPLLQKALQLWEFLDAAHSKYDSSNWSLPSISPHEQNQETRSWTYLIALCRDLWGFAWDIERDLAVSILSVWRTIKYPAFRRLVLYAYTVKDIVIPEDALNYLLEDDSYWLWDITVEREKFRLLASIWPRLSDAATKKLLNAVLVGPSRDIYQKLRGFTDQEWLDYLEHQIWCLLEKLKDFGRGLDIEAESRLADLKLKHPEWSLQKENKDEFAAWFGEVKQGYPVDKTEEELFALPTLSLLAVLKENHSKYNEGRLDLFRTGTKRHRAKVIAVLRKLKDNGDWDTGIWHAALIGLTEANDSSWTEVSKLLLEADPVLLSKESWAISFWVAKATKHIAPHSDNENYFWRLLDKLLEALPNDFELNDTNRVIDVAINQPIGYLTEAFVERLSQSGIKEGEGLTNLDHLKFLDQILGNKKTAFILGRALLARNLAYFYHLDPMWTASKLIPLFNWDISEDAYAMWQGYLWSPRITPDLILELKDQFIISLDKGNKIKDYIEQLHRLFTSICLEFPGIYTIKEQQQALRKMGVAGLEDIAKFFLDSVRQENGDNYWENRIKPFIDKVWPRDQKFLNSGSAEYLALMCVKLNRTFPDAVSTVKPLLIQLNTLQRFLHDLSQTNLPEKEPDATFELLETIFNQENEEFSIIGKWLKDVFDRLLKAQPRLKNNSAARLITEFLLKKDG